MFKAEDLGRTPDVEKRKNSVNFMVKVLDYDQTGKPHPNVAELVDEQDLRKIGQKVLTEYKIDKDSRSEWEDINERATNLAKQTWEVKSYPWPGAANVKYPLITEAAIQFASRAYPEVCQSRQIVHCAVLGDDPQGEKKERAIRIEQHMSWQLLEDMESWEEELDRLLHILPITGMCFRKTYYCESEQRNRSDLCLPEDVVINYYASSLETARRITHRYKVYQNEVVENVLAGRWLDAKLPSPSSPEATEDEDAPHIFLEQHRFLDLDGDGYQEPWIVTVHEETGEVVRIVARFEESGVSMDEKGKVKRIEPLQYFTKFGFMPSPDGGVYDIGFGYLLFPINTAINTVLNQLLDAGHLANMQGGWIDRKVRQVRGKITFDPGEWKPTDTGSIKNLRDSILPLPNKEPSSALFNLLGTLIEAGKDMANLKDVLQGDSMGANTPATTVMALIEQGTKRFTAIYKRLYRSLGQEFKKVFRLNSIYLDTEQYFTFLDNESVQRIGAADYTLGDFDVVPVSDPNMASEMQRMAQARAIMEALQGRPNINEDEITTRITEALHVTGSAKLIIPPEERPKPEDDPQYKLQMEQMKLERDKFELDLMKFLVDQEKNAAKIAEIQAKTADLLASAESKEVGPQLQAYLADVQGMYQSAIQAMRGRQDEEKQRKQMEQQQAQQSQQQPQQGEEPPGQPQGPPPQPGGAPPPMGA